MQDPSQLRNADGTRAVPKFEDRQQMRRAIHEAQTPGYNQVTTNEGFDPSRINVAEVLLRQYPHPPKPGTQERRTYDRLLAQKQKWLEEKATEDERAAAQDLWRESKEYNDALAAFNDARGYIDDPAKIARLDTLLHQGGEQMLSTFWQELGQLAAEQRMLKSEVAGHYEAQMSQLKENFALASRDSARLDSVLMRARHALGQPEPTSPAPQEGEGAPDGEG